MTVKYKTVITKAGAEKLAAATVPNGKKVNFTAMAVGDGGGTLPVPDAGQTKLVNEVWRHALNKISQDNKHQNYVIAELLIPPETGGFWMREMGLYDDTGTLIAVGNMAESYKPLLEEGSGRAQTVRMVVMVSDIASVELSIDTSTVMATQEYVDEKLEEHEQSRRHPDATLTAKGFTQLSSATDSSSEVLAATPKAVKAAYDLANGKYTAQDATTAQKGIVQLSSATNSESESLAATPKAVKTVSDDVAKLKNSLGTAAGKNVQESRDDITPGRVLVNGGALALRTVAARAGTAIADASALPANSVSFCYADAAYSPGYEATILDVGGLGGDGYRVQYAASYSDGGKRLKFRTLNGDNGYWGRWTNVLTNYGGDVDHLSNCSYYQTNPTAWPGVGAFAEQYGNAAPFNIPYGRVTPQGQSQYLPIIKAITATEGYGFGAAVSFGVLRSGNNDFGSAVIHIIGDNGEGAMYGFDTKGTFSASRQIYSGGRVDAAGDITSAANIYASGQLNSGGNIVAGQGLYESGGLVRVYSSNNPPPNQSGSTNTGNYSAYYRHGNGQIFMQCIGGVYSNSRTNPDVTVYLPASFPNGILAIAGSFSGNGGIDSDSWWSATAISANAFNLHTRNTDGTFSFVVTGY
ncbi:TPA: phage tail protein [Enterobacter chuandaensis]|uniref:phage tail protein n=1 Tax=Enterobacter nematophilus TaxID=2994648 RepID=UPI003303931F|nr:phage tail protein [Enterobacter chuandaensis]